MTRADYAGVVSSLQTKRVDEGGKRAVGVPSESWQRSPGFKRDALRKSGRQSDERRRNSHIMASPQSSIPSPPSAPPPPPPPRKGEEAKEEAIEMAPIVTDAEKGKEEEETTKDAVPLVGCVSSTSSFSYCCLRGRISQAKWERCWCVAYIVTLLLVILFAIYLVISLFIQRNGGVVFTTAVDEKGDIHIDAAWLKGHAYQHVASNEASISLFSLLVSTHSSFFYLTSLFSFEQEVHFGSSPPEGHEHEHEHRRALRHPPPPPQTGKEKRRAFTTGKPPRSSEETDTARRTTTTPPPPPPPPPRPQPYSSSSFSFPRASLEGVVGKEENEHWTAERSGAAAGAAAVSGEEEMDDYVEEYKEIFSSSTEESSH
jgi:hypothetical protein